MTNAARIILAVVLLFVVAFCVFGFLGTLEPESQNVAIWRTLYAAFGSMALIGAMWLLWIAWPRESE